MKPRILHLITDLEIGGATLFVRNLAVSLARAGCDLHVACLAPTGPLVDDLRRAGLPVHPLGARGPHDLRAVVRLARLLGRLRPQILHCTLVHAAVAGRLVGRLCGVPHIVVTIQTAEHGVPWHLTAETLTCRLSDRTVCVSPSVYRHTRRRSHVPPARLIVIPNAIDAARFAAAEPLDLTAHDIPAGRPTLIFVGRFDPVKNIPILLRALARLVGRHDPHLLLLGDGPQRPLLERLTADLNLTGRVHFLGMQRNVAAWLKSADLFVLPSQWEGLSLSTLEAMAAGVPVVVSRVPGLIDLVTHEQTGLLAAPSDPDDLAAALDRLLVDPPFARCLADAAQTRVRHTYALPAVTRQHLSLYQSLLQK